eukprot:TRINITY_DN96666_c0_g1_i1.p1 TRINITY_DN96666_c0_g1~~TRINITY_DN96666_c0_g1_i1.p1  ORF type:complete len:197 (-),score=9.33 TRINITY_DN96666_c0_g1_i1:171-761(-)
MASWTTEMNRPACLPELWHIPDVLEVEAAWKCACARREVRRGDDDEQYQLDFELRSWQEGVQFSRDEGSTERLANPGRNQAVAAAFLQPCATPSGSALRWESKLDFQHAVSSVAALPSQSVLHDQGRCTPCAFQSRGRDCRHGDACRFCHRCDRPAFNRWKRWMRQATFFASRATADVELGEDSKRWRSTNQFVYQ